LGTPSSANLTNATGYTTANLVGTISNAQLANSTISGVSLGSNLANLTAGTNITFSSGTTYNGSTAITINGSAAQVYPGAGIPNSTGSAWGTSYSTTGSGTVVALATSPTFVTPILGTPTSVTLTNATGLPLTTGVTGTLGVTNGGTGVTTSTGSGNNVLSTSPTLVTPVLGTPTSVTLTNATGLPLTTGVTGTLPIANGGTGQTTASAAFNALSPITTTGDLILGNGTNSATRLAIGANTYVLTSNGTTASWQASSGGGGSSISNGTSNVTVNSSGGTVTIATAGTTALTVDTSQNVGIGVTPDTWNTGGGKTLQLTAGAISAYSTDNIQMVQNIYFNSAWIYKTSNYATIYNQSVGQHTWFTAPSGTAGNAPSLTQVMTLDNSGNLLVGTTANDPITGIHDRLQVYTTGSAQFAGFFDNQSTTSAYGVGVRSYTGANMYFFNGTGVSSVGAISTTGSTTTYSPTSDIRLKTNIKPITNGLERISKLKPVDYNWIADGIADNGFIAQDLLEIPEFAHRVTKVGLNNNGEPFYGVDYMKFVAVLTSAIQEQQSTIQSLTARLTALENK
jgi:hypothetical protein